MVAIVCRVDGNWVNIDMKTNMRMSVLALIIVLGTTGCASITDNLIATPTVELQNVEVVGLGFSNQTFLLSFDVSNPNPFALPIDSIAYGVKLDGHRFASGETNSDISVPASGSAEFAISVELNLIKTAPQLLSIVREGVRSEIPYELEGAFGIDIPMAPIVRYENRGSIQLRPNSY